MNKVRFSSRQFVRFQRSYQRNGDCFIWIAKKVKGYPVFFYRDSYYQAQKLSLGIVEKDRKTFVRTTCGNKDCVNPNHLVVSNETRSCLENVTGAKNTK